MMERQVFYAIAKQWNATYGVCCSVDFGRMFVSKAAAMLEADVAKETLRKVGYEIVVVKVKVVPIEA